MNKMISKIGGKLISNTDEEFDVVLLEKPAKTAKVMIAVAKCLPVVSVKWLEDSVLQKE